MRSVDDTFFSVNEFGAMLIGREARMQPEVRNPYLNYVAGDDDTDPYQVVDTTSGRYPGVSEPYVAHGRGQFRAPDRLERALVLFEPGPPGAHPLAAELRARAEAVAAELARNRVDVALYSVDVARYPGALLMMRGFPGGPPTHVPVLLYFADRVVVYPPLFWTNAREVSSLPSLENLAADVVRARRKCRVEQA